MVSNIGSNAFGCLFVGWLVSFRFVLFRVWKTRRTSMHDYSLDVCSLFKESEWNTRKNETKGKILLLWVVILVIIWFDNCAFFVLIYTRRCEGFFLGFGTIFGIYSFRRRRPQAIHGSRRKKKKQNNTKTKTIYPFESLLLTKTLLSLVYICIFHRICSILLLFLLLFLLQLMNIIFTFNYYCYYY